MIRLQLGYMVNTNINCIEADTTCMHAHDESANGAADLSHLVSSLEKKEDKIQGYKLIMETRASSEELWPLNNLYRTNSEVSRVLDQVRHIKPQTIGEGTLELILYALK